MANNDHLVNLAAAASNVQESVDPAAKDNKVSSTCIDMGILRNDGELQLQYQHGRQQLCLQQVRMLCFVFLAFLPLFAAALK